MALPERVVAFAEAGHSHRAAAARFRVSVTFVNDMVISRRETGGLEPRAPGAMAVVMASWLPFRAGSRRGWHGSLI